ncbi:MAG: ABC transporter ATP-binding protein [Lachnospiraceae bacterium]
MKTILTYLKGYEKETILAPLFKMLEAGFELFVPLVVAAIIDVGIDGNDKGYIVKMCMVLVLLGIVGLISSVTAQYFAAKAAVGFSKKLRHALFDKMQSLSFSEIDSLGTASMITRMTSDVNQVQSGVNLVLRLFLRSPFIVFGAMIMAFTVDVKAALIFTVVIPVLSVIVFGIMLITIPMYKKVQKALDRVLGITRENLTGIRVIRAFCKEKEEIERFDNANDRLTVMQKIVGRISGLMNPMTYIVINAGIVALIYTGAVRVEAGIITQGAVVALYNYMSQILVELIKLANLIITVTKSFASGKRLEAVLRMESSLKLNNVNVYDDGSENKKNIPVVRFDHVSLTYQGAGEEALSDIDFTVNKGETVGIIGGTGSGKSSLVHLIPHFYDATKGRVEVNGIDVRDYPIDVLREKIGIVMQKPVLFKATIRENLLWGNKDATDEDIYEALKTAQALDVIESKEDGLDEMVAQGGKNFSGGQRQRLTIARALVRKPEILILDDSASALDYATDAALRKSLLNIKERPAVFIVSQRTSSIQHADKIIVLDDGKVAGMGTHKELLRSCDVYREIYDSQFKGAQEVAANE